MDAGQITQGLRADSFQQNVNGNGVSAAQMTGDGFSFADIMSVIIANGQEMQNVDNMQMLQNFSDNQFVENLSDMQNLFELNDLQGCQELLNIINNISNKNEFDVLDLQNLNKIFNALNLHDPSELKKVIFEISNLFDSKNSDFNIDKNNSLITTDNFDSNEFANNYNDLVLKYETDKNDSLIISNTNSDFQNIDNINFDHQDSDDMNADHQNFGGMNADHQNFDSANTDNQKIYSTNSDRQNIGSSNFGSQNENTLYLQKNHYVSSNYVNDGQNLVNETEALNKNVLNIQNTISSNLNSGNSDLEIAYETIDNPKSEKDYLSSENLNISNKHVVSNINNLDDLNDNLKSELDSASVSHLHNVSDKKEIYSVKNISGQQSDIKIKDLSNGKFKTLKSQNSNEKVDKSSNLSDKSNIPELQVLQDMQNVQSIKADVYSAYNVMNLRDIHAVSDILGFSRDEKSLIRNNANYQNVGLKNPISQKLIEIFSIASPEILKAFENEPAEKNLNNGSKFVMDLISELSSEKNKSDIFDFSESVVKVDPLQLAGLLDFISTGTTIPQADDVSDSQLFKNIDKTEVVENSSGKLIFDPEEMIRTGEMEIVSYVPAEKSSDAHLKQDKNPLENGEKTIDFARTMKSVKENVKPSFVDDTEEPKDNIAMTVEDMSSSAEKIDISFDRAYAELEMNKAKYGSADEQLFKGIAESLKKGRSEFTVKLRPEGLGEILVKLVSNEAGKTILSMVASSEKTAQLLNRDLASLQSSLNQHNVEIENNNVKTVETVMAAQSSFDQYDERRQDEASQQNQFRKLRSKLGNISVGNVSFESESEPVNNINIDSALNITI